MIGDPARFLVNGDWLAAHLDDPELRLLDVTGMLTATFQNLARERHYALGHIPGAAFLDVASAKGEFTDPSAPFPWGWPRPEDFAALMGRLGVGNGTRVVLYAASPRKGVDNGPMWATRAWWVMHHFGVDCAVLNGGWEGWLARGGASTTEAPSPAPARFVPSADWRRGLADRTDVLAAIGDGATCLVDALTRESFAGTAKLAYGPRKGHIPGAVNLPMGELVDRDTGRFADRDTMRARLSGAGLLGDKRVIAYCGGAIAATVDAFALALLGRDNVAVYDGSLFEWAADPSLPMHDPSAG